LTRRANQGQNEIIEDYMARAAIRQRAFSLVRRQVTKFGFDLRQFACRIFIKFDSSGKSAGY
jgi:hypothetical protein